MKQPAVCAMWCRTTCFRLWRCWRWNRLPTRAMVPCRQKRPKCSRPCVACRRRMSCAASIADTGMNRAWRKIRMSRPFAPFACLSTPGAGRGCRGTYAPASAWQSLWPRCSLSSSLHRNGCSTTLRQRPGALTMCAFVSPQKWKLPWPRGLSVSARSLSACSVSFTCSMSARAGICPMRGY